MQEDNAQGKLIINQTCLRFFNGYWYSESKNDRNLKKIKQKKRVLDGVKP